MQLVMNINCKPAIISISMKTSRITLETQVQIRLISSASYREEERVESIPINGVELISCSAALLMKQLTHHVAVSRRSIALSLKGALRSNQDRLTTHR